MSHRPPIRRPEEGSSLRNPAPGRRFPLAGGLLAGRARTAGLAALLAMTGCLIPQDDRLLPPEPFFPDRAPYFITTTPRSAYLDTASTCVFDFGATVADPDVNDTIRVRYYVDFDATTNPGFVKEITLTNHNTEARPETATYSVDVTSARNPLGPVGIHIVEAVAFDWTINELRVPDPIPGAGDAGPNPSYAVFHQWVVQHLENTCP